MSNKYKHGDRVPSDVLCSRLGELANVVTQGRDAVAREFTMRVPAEMDYDADLVLSAASRRIAELEAQVALLEATLGMEYRILYGDGDRAPTGFMNLQPLSPTVEDMRLIRDEHERIKGILHERTVRLAKYETGGGEVKSQWISVSEQEPPKDGTSVLGFFPCISPNITDQRFVLIHWCGWGGGVWDDANGYHITGEPSYWMPLPAPPLTP